MQAEMSIWSLSLWISYLAASFLLGAVPFGRLIGRRVAKVDITQMGSGNIGATNVARELGMKWGIVTLILDFLKGFVPAFSFHRLFPASDIGLLTVGVCALLGHQFTPFLRFRGGRGVATALGFFIVISPTSTILALCVFIAMVYLWDFISLASMAAAFSVPLFLALFGKSGATVGASLLSAGLICFKHRDNIRRLLSGKERRWRKKEVMGAE